MQIYSKSKRAAKVKKRGNSADITFASEERIDFELFKSNVCHRLKALGDIDFIIETLKENKIRHYYNIEWYPECFYSLAMLDYISRKNDVPLCNAFDDIRKLSLTETIYPLSIVTMAYAFGSDDVKKQAYDEAIPEFIKYNIVESDVYNVV